MSRMSEKHIVVTDSSSLRAVLSDVVGERKHQDDKWGPAPDNFLDRKDGTGGHMMQLSADAAKFATDNAAKLGLLTWALILNEEVKEALAEDDPVKLRAELVQVAAVCAAWIETIDAR